MNNEIDQVLYSLVNKLKEVDFSVIEVSKDGRAINLEFEGNKFALTFMREATATILFFCEADLSKRTLLRKIDTVYLVDQLNQVLDFAQFKFLRGKNTRQRLLVSRRFTYKVDADNFTCEVLRFLNDIKYASSRKDWKRLVSPTFIPMKKRDYHNENCRCLDN